MTEFRPESYETEVALLGALMRYADAEIVTRCWKAGLLPEDFHRPQHRVVYETIVAMLQRGDAFDELGVINELKRAEVPTERGKTVNALAFAGGHAAVLTLVEKCGLAAMIESYCQELISVNLSREVIRVGEDLQQQGAALKPIPEIVTDAEQRLAAARDRAEGRHSGRRVSDAADLLQQLLEHYISPDPDDVLSFPLPTLNAIGGGMFPGDIIVLGARSGIGKSWWGLDAVEQAMGAGRRSALFSLEMPAMQMMRRLLAMGGHSLTGIKKRAVPYDQLIERVGVIDAWRGLLDVLDGPTNVDRIRAELASARIDGRPYRVVVLDHLHLLDVPGGDAAYRVALNRALTQLKHLAIENGCTIVLLAQLKRPAPGREKERPTIHDLRESGGIGDIADYVLLVHREPGHDGYPSNAGVVIVDKVRDGAGACDIDVTFDPRTYRFREGYMAGSSPDRRDVA